MTATAEIKTFISYSTELNGWNWECWKGLNVIGRGKRENNSRNDAEFFAKLFVKKQTAFDKISGY